MVNPDSEDLSKSKKTIEPSDQEKKEEIQKIEQFMEETAKEEESLDALKTKTQNYLDQLLRLQAEFANYRKRVEKEKMEALKFGRVIMIERMITILDVMEGALKHSQNATDINSLIKGFEIVVQEFFRFLKSEGAQPLKTLGEHFDPHLHEALEQIETNKEEENNIILEEIQKGYTLNGQLIRPAKVKVAKIRIKETK
ncbi:MAG: nucleotide exchange factor GrpE [Elusimicrobia bacterium RIFCSPLOWO2_02_FULL_39_32]|nr:MAG: nucleotide exchange factor GrpE [Elusimicrobia bacterium GWA2_38_7]OGR79590.1 MAG: nucleotide exchange factor GrpE [Elusimicrobia bacterium RIFCSPHIGHO2_02_FULL_39_36]OGR92917.1 MAG: nucleotide exchange factor GrpE [Elusimicrobia bacterium RIFCSPLOWO2_02_FULL_39_32]OGR99700.1 MAG: nucleotide exchange factor GrpE [Elusimicrobia bacterium RIFCSPLOWO2_12_FULL_39_28]